MNATTRDGDTPLHAVAKNLGNRNPTEIAGFKEVVDLLLEHGAHFDAANRRGVRAGDLLKSAADICELNYITLQCMSARVIRRNNLTYRGLLPPVICHFIDMH